jgi:glutathione S-transferase
MTKPTLTYFDFSGGRGEASRLALHIADIDWIDDRFSGSWPEAKKQTPFGGLPVLEVPGRGTLSQSNAILGYLGREYGLLPADSWEAARHESIMNAVEELRARAETTGRDDEDEKKKAREDFAAGYLARWAENLCAQIRGPFIGGDALSVADLKVFVALRSYTTGVYDHIPTDVLEPFEDLTALIAAVGAHPRVADWYARQS